MFIKIKRCKLYRDIMMRLYNCLCVFNLRQGAILIAVHQIALSSFLLIIFLVGISHAGDMLSMLRNDMEDDAERRGFSEGAYGDRLTFHEGRGISTINEMRFAKAQHLASVTVIFLYTCTILTSIYLMSCISLLHGAVKCKTEYLVPWIMAASVAVVIILIAIILAGSYPSIVNSFGGRFFYHFGCSCIVVTYIYAICAVASFAIETDGSRLHRVPFANDERGERLLLLDHAAHSSLLSAAQLHKLSHGTRTQFV